MDTLMLNVVEILPEAADTVTILLQRADQRPLEYQAGQFLTFLFKSHNTPSADQDPLSVRELRRSYSLSSTPGVDPLPAITVKRVTNGEISRYLLDHLRVGDQLTSLLPSGRFTLDNNPPLLFFIGAGSGMTPIFSLIKQALQNMPDTRVILLSQHNDHESVLFKRQLAELATKHTERFNWINLLSNKQGRLNNWWLEELLGKLLLNLPAPLFYLCGPPAFMRMAQFTLRVMGFKDSRIKKENFTVEYVPPPPLIDPTPRHITIRAGDRTYQYQSAWPSTILQAGLDQHIPLPYSCKGGRCSTCVAKCLSGQVKMSVNEVLTEKDLQEGLILTCVGYAQTDVELQY